jgi:hypothetical protein
MATRTIVTSQPDVACDVCERRLLRGEQPDVFLAAGRRRIVCELCAPRAAHEGWMRESESQSLTLPPMRARRGRSFFDRLRQVARPPGDTGATSEQQQEAQASYDLFDGYTSARAEPIAATPPASPLAPEQELAQPESGEQHIGGDDPLDWHADLPLSGSASASETGAGAAARGSSYVEQAIEVFNASEFPRRVAGVARSLGAPAVNIRSADHLSSVVSIVVAWELCWYRYEIDLSEPVVEAQVIAQGTELSELTREDRRANAAAGESGLLAMAAV